MSFKPFHHVVVEVQGNLSVHQETPVDCPLHQGGGRSKSDQLLRLAAFNIFMMLRDSLGCFLLALLGLSVINVAQAAIFPAKGAVLNLTGKTWKDKAKDGVSASQVVKRRPWH